MNGRISESGKAAISSYIGSRSDRGPGVVGRSRLRSNGVLSAGSPETKKPSRGWVFFIWRRARDSNPGYPCGYNGFRIRFRPTNDATQKQQPIDNSGIYEHCLGLARRLLGDSFPQNSPSLDAPPRARDSNPQTYDPAPLQAAINQSLTQFTRPE